jgi:hypothetical protein
VALTYTADMLTKERKSDEGAARTGSSGKLVLRLATSPPHIKLLTTLYQSLIIYDRIETKPTRESRMGPETPG